MENVERFKLINHAIWGEYVKAADYDKLLDQFSSYEAEINYLLAHYIPSECLVRVREGGGPENIMASLIVSLTKTFSKYGVNQRISGN